MSSILDALRKLEEEKSRSSTPLPTPFTIDQPDIAPIAPRTARQRRRGRGQSNQRTTLIPVAAAIGGMLVVGSALGILNSRSKQSDPSSQSTNVAAASVVEPDVMSAPIIEPRTEESLAPEPAPEIVIAAAETQVDSTAVFASPESIVFTEPEGQTEALEVEVSPAPVSTDSEQSINSVHDETELAEETAIETSVEGSLQDAFDSLESSESDPATGKTVSDESEPAAERIVASVEPSAPEFDAESENTEVPLDEPVDTEAQVTGEPEPFVSRFRTAPAEEVFGDQPLQAASQRIAKVDVRTQEVDPEPVNKVEADIRRLPPLTDTVRAQYDIPEIRINMLKQSDQRQSVASALIDYNKVYVGEPIPNTRGRAHLVGVDIRGIAVEIDGNRFYYLK